jgi:hypothetical protein
MLDFGATGFAREMLVQAIARIVRSFKMKIKIQKIMGNLQNSTLSFI